jgi:Fe2+ transport system protein B
MEDIDKIIEQRARELVESGKVDEAAVAKFKPTIDFKIDHEKAYSEQAKDIVGVKATETALKDEELAKSVTERKKAELLNFADASLKNEEAENKKAEIKLQEANFGVYDGVATYAGIKKPLPQKMQNVLFSILSAIQTILLIMLGVPISIINIVADGVDSVVKKLETLTRSARWIVLLAILVGAAYLAFIVINHLLAVNGISL